MKRSASEALVVAEKSQLPQLPLQLWLSPRILEEKAASLKVLVASQPRYAALAESEDGALLVLPDFQQEELAALEKRKRRVLGLPFVERFLQDPCLLGKVPALPLFDLIYRSPGAICFSAMEPALRARQQGLARWLGGRTSGELQSSELLVATRVSICPESKYQEALSRRLPVVKPSYLEAMWAEKQLVDVQSHHLPPLAGLAICFDADCLADREGASLRDAAMAQGALIVAFDQAELVVVSDASRPLYQVARRLGQPVAPPKWLERCLQIRCCLQVTGDLEVPQPGVVGSAEGQVELILQNSVLCLLYLEPGSREAARAWARRCGAWTTRSPRDPGATHVLFNVLPRTSVCVSIPVDEEIHFLDVSWLEACATSGKRASEWDFPRQQVIYNPASDSFANDLREPRKLRKVHSILDEESLPAVTASTAAPSLSDLPAPLADAEPSLSPPSAEGIFKGLVLGIALRDEAKVVQMVCQNGGTAVHGVGGNIAALSKSKLDYCICGNGPVTNERGLPLATLHWVKACAEEKTLHSTGAYPHFQPSSHSFPLASMSRFLIRITGLDEYRQSTIQRRRLEELIQVLGAKVAQHNNRQSELTQIVCAVVANLDPRIADSAKKRQIPVVSVQWLFDCFRLGSHQPEANYASSASSVSAAIEGAAPAASSVAVLAKCEVFVSLSAVAAEPKLMQMAKELGASARSFRRCSELELTETGDAVVVVDKEEARQGQLEPVEKWTPELRALFVQPSWLLETYSQRRRLPLQTFGAFPEESTKKLRLAEAAYAWQPAELKRLEELSEQARARDLQSKAQQKVTEGLRLAKLGS
ncbi:unnamed protein product [Effrenium voratum]|nr:unnamed protein product [Effrenium voratum]